MTTTSCEASQGPTRNRQTVQEIDPFEEGVFDFKTFEYFMREAQKVRVIYASSSTQR